MPPMIGRHVQRSPVALAATAAVEAQSRRDGERQTVCTVPNGPPQPRQDIVAEIMAVGIIALPVASGGL
jgi:hypothetical protein